jgi:hypothetical protein
VRRGDQDRAAAFVLRHQNPANYLVARVSATELDLRIFRTLNDIRRTLPGGRVVVPADDGAWHVLEFRAEGPTLAASVDGQATASSYDTFFGRGRAGLWTKSDATTDFDDLTAESIAESTKQARRRGGSPAAFEWSLDGSGHRGTRTEEPPT